MTRLASIALAAVLVAAGLAHVSAQQDSQAAKLLAGAKHKATVVGDLRGAIEDYKRIVDGAGPNRALAAEALLRIAECLAIRPDGRALATTFTSGPTARNVGGVPDAPTTSHISVVGIDGTPSRTLYGPVVGRSEPGTMNTFPRLSEPTWSEDGLSILFGRHEDDGSWTLWRVPAAGGQPDPIGGMTSDEVKRNGSNPMGFTLTADGKRAAHFAVPRAGPQMNCGRSICRVCSSQPP